MSTTPGYHPIMPPGPASVTPGARDIVKVTKANLGAAALPVSSEMIAAKTKSCGERAAILQKATSDFMKKNNCDYPTAWNAICRDPKYSHVVDEMYH